ncbi:MAG: c-type cytochrome [Candidatus Acidiferrales bacterium]
MLKARWQVAFLIFVAAGALSGCRGGHTLPSYSVFPTIEVEQGKQVIENYKCGSCHTIPGIQGAKGVVGPPLAYFGKRSYIAGNFPNAPGVLVRWIMNAPAMKPKTAMPDLGVPQAEARDAAAYLENLR